MTFLLIQYKPKLYLDLLYTNINYISYYPIETNFFLYYLSLRLQVLNFIKKILQHGCFPMNIAKFLRAPILKNICGRLLLRFIVSNVKLSTPDT